MSDETVRCHIYRSTVREGLYVYVAASDAADPNGAQALERLPPPVRRQLGRAELAMTLDLDRNRRLGQENIEDVLANLATQGFHVQMPRDIEPLVTAVADAAVADAAKARSREER